MQNMPHLEYRISVLIPLSAKLLSFITFLRVVTVTLVRKELALYPLQQDLHELRRITVLLRLLLGLRPLTG